MRISFFKIFPPLQHRPRLFKKNVARTGHKRCLRSGAEVSVLRNTMALRALSYAF